MSSSEHRNAQASYPEDVLAKSHEELEPVADKELITAYERLRDEERVGSRGRHFPNIRRLYGTPLEREKDRRETRVWAESSGGEMQEWYEVARTKPCTWWLENHLVAKNALTGCMACGICTSLCPAAEYYEDYNPRTIVDAALSNDETQLVELLKSETLWYCGQCGSCKPKFRPVLILLGEMAIPHPTNNAGYAARMITHGPYRTLFWLGAVVLGGLLPALLLSVGAFNAILVDLSALLGLGGLLAFEWCFVMAGQRVPNS